MVNLRLQRRLASSIMGAGKSRVWMDPNEVNEIHLANSRRAVTKLIKDSFIIKKSVSMHCRQRARLRQEEKRLGRHTGLGKRRGQAGARMPTKVLWMRRQRTLRRLLKKYREAKKIDRHLYRELYLACKAGQYKSKKNLIDAVEKILYKKNLENKTAGQKTALKVEEKKTEKKHEEKKPVVEKEKKPAPEKKEKKVAQVQEKKETQEKEKKQPAKQTQPNKTQAKKDK